jgi:hypothetical protein
MKAERYSLAVSETGVLNIRSGWDDFKVTAGRKSREEAVFKKCYNMYENVEC